MIEKIKDKINFLYSNYMTKNLIKKYDFVEKKNLVRLGSVYGGWTFENKKIYMVQLFYHVDLEKI